MHLPLDRRRHLQVDIEEVHEIEQDADGEQQRREASSEGDVVGQDGRLQENRGEDEVITESSETRGRFQDERAVGV